MLITQICITSYTFQTETIEFHEQILSEGIIEYEKQDNVSVSALSVIQLALLHLEKFKYAPTFYF